MRSGAPSSEVPPASLHGSPRTGVAGNSPPRAFIGICAVLEKARWSFWNQDAALVADTYLRSVQRAGGRPLILAPDDLDQTAADALLDRVDGLLLIGGTDVDPETYGHPRSVHTEQTVPARDRFELTLVTAALQRDLPILGICRGLQVMNVATGGTLYQDLATHGFREHRPAPGSLGRDTHHEVDVEPGSILWSGDGRRMVNSHHHQGVAQVGAGGHVIARSVPDGLVEAIQWPSHQYAVGVQWHPEAMELGEAFTELASAAVAR